MLIFDMKPYYKELDGHLVVKSLADARDVERLAAFNGLIHGSHVAGMTRELILHHPHTRPEHWLFVEDEKAGQIVSSLCLIPWIWRYEDVELKAGEMGIVGTLEPYRRRGLIRAMNVRFDELLHEGHFDLSHIQGIPYFYRQFGYEYALPLEGGWHIEMRQIPDVSADQPLCCGFRRAGLDDLPALMKLYDQSASDLNISAVRNEAEWHYLFGPSMRTEMVAETWLVLGEQGHPLDYFRVPAHGFSEGLILNEASRMSYQVALSVLCHLKQLALEREKPYIRLCLSAGHALLQAARIYGAHDQGHYAWQIKLVDAGSLLQKMASVFERRVADSLLVEATQAVCLNLYREAFDLHFERGRLAAVDALGFKDGGNIHIPPLLLAPLVLGYRSREELSHVYPDFSAWGEGQLWLDVLFPKMSSFIYTIY